jgi:hypothetical protein
MDRTHPFIERLDPSLDRSAFSHLAGVRNEPILQLFWQTRCHLNARGHIAKVLKIGALFHVDLEARNLVACNAKDFLR